jgi:hypothetical protein
LSAWTAPNAGREEYLKAGNLAEARLAYQIALDHTLDIKETEMAQQAIDWIDEQGLNKK